MFKKTIITTCLLAVIGIGFSVGYTEHQKVKGYELHLSNQYVNDFAQIAGYVNMTDGYLSLILENKEMAVEEQEALVHGLYEISYVLDKYEQLASDINRGEVRQISYVPTTFASFIAQIDTSKPLTPDQLEKLEVADRLLHQWNKSVVSVIPELNAEKETYQAFFDSYKEEGIRGEEWLDVLHLFEKETLYAIRNLENGSLEEYFNQ